MLNIQVIYFWYAIGTQSSTSNLYAQIVGWNVLPLMCSDVLFAEFSKSLILSNSLFFYPSLLLWCDSVATSVYGLLVRVCGLKNCHNGHLGLLQFDVLVSYFTHHINNHIWDRDQLFDTLLKWKSILNAKGEHKILKHQTMKDNTKIYINAQT